MTTTTKTQATDCPAWCTRDHVEAAKVGSTFHESADAWQAELTNGTGRRDEIQVSIESDHLEDEAHVYVGIDNLDDFLSPADAKRVAYEILRHLESVGYLDPLEAVRELLEEAAEAGR